MGRIFSFLVIFIAIIAGVAPFLEGYLFKSIFMQRINYIQHELNANNNVKISVDEYKIAYLQSNVKMTITITSKAAPNGMSIPPIIFRVDSLINHGPVLYDQGKLKLGAATVETDIHQPDLLSKLTGTPDAVLLNVKSYVTINGDLWTSHYEMPAISSSGAITGDLVVKTLNGTPIAASGKFSYAGLNLPFTQSLPFLPAVIVAPIDYVGDASLQAKNIWKGKSSLTTAGFGMRWQDGSIITAENIAMDSSYGPSASGFDGASTITLKKLIMPATYPFTEVSDVKFQVTINNLNENGLNELSENLRSPKKLDTEAQIANTLKILKADSSLHVDANFNTNLGKAVASVVVTLQALPKNKNELITQVNTEVMMRIAIPVAEKVLTFYLAQHPPMQPMTPPPAMADGTQAAPAVAEAQPLEPLAQAQAFIASLMQQGVLVQEQNDYVVNFSKKGPVLILNGKDISATAAMFMQPGAPASAPAPEAAAPAPALVPAPAPEAAAPVSSPASAPVPAH
jgi:hypothetical protein